MGPFSTLPRVELPGARLSRLGGRCLDDFQYPTSGRTAWSVAALADQHVRVDFQYPTSGRTAWSERAWLEY